MRRFLIKISKGAIIPFIFICCILSYNILTDPYGVINQDMNKQVTEPNQHFLKTKYILQNPKKYNCFLFGSSRVGKIDVAQLSPSKTWYNMAYSEGIPKEHLQDIRLFLNSGVKINKIIIGLDEVSCFVKPQKHLNEPLRKAYLTRFDPLIDYLLLQPSLYIYKEIKNTPNKHPKPYKVIYENNGAFKRNSKDLYIDKHKEEHCKNPIFNTPYWPSSNTNNITSSISDIQQIIKICKKKNIKLVLFINPIYIETYKKAVSKGFLQFINLLSENISFYDFSGANEITTCKSNYYENTHYRPVVGDLIIKELQLKESKYLRKMNFDNKIQLSKEEF